MPTEIRPVLDEPGVTWAAERAVRRASETDLMLMPGSPPELAAVERLPVRRGRKLGEHTNEMLLEILTRSEAEVARLHATSTVAGSVNSAFASRVD